MSDNSLGILLLTINAMYMTMMTTVTVTMKAMTDTMTITGVITISVLLS